MSETTHLNPSVELLLADPAAVDVIARSCGLSHHTARIIVARGFDTPDAARRFLEPSLERDWLEPELIAGMPEAAKRVAQAIRDGQRICVFGDFDLDGISSSAVAARGLAQLGADVVPLVPHRFREGYGLSDAAIARMYEAVGPQLVVTVDTGISSAAEVEQLRVQGVSVVVTDHHEPGELVPRGVCVANPKLDADGASRDLSGAGVALKLVQAVGRIMGRPDLWLELTDLATLGTIADIVPLTGENRALVADGIRRMQRDPRACIAALAAVAGVSLEQLHADAIAFALAPRLNAAGRMADPAVALKLLMTDDPVEAERLAVALDEHNRDRQDVEAELTQAATALAERVFRPTDRSLVLAGEGWHEGVKGIVASRLAKSYGVPVILFSIEDGEARGSGRSVGTVNLFEAVSACSDVVERFGGHAAAVGLTVRADRLEEFGRRFASALAGLPQDRFASPLEVDAEVPLGAVGVELGAEFERLAPFGHMNPRPRILIPGVFMTSRQRVGRSNDHLRFVAYDGADSVGAIAFRCPDIERLAEHDAAVDLIGGIEVDEWRGKTRAQLLVSEIRERTHAEDAPAAALVEDLFVRADAILAREDYAGVEEAPAFHTKLAGVTFEGRQEVLGRLRPGTPLRLERQPDNPHDTNACALFEPGGEQVGFLNRRLAAVIAPVLDSGVEYDVSVTEVTGGTEGRSLGVNVLVERRGAAAETAEAAEVLAARRAELAALSHDELDRVLTSLFIGDRQLHEAQARALAYLNEGRSTLAVMATGRGKSLIFQLHAVREALRHRHASVFVYPLRALVADQAFSVQEHLAEVGLSARVVTGESGPAERDEAFSALKAGELDVVLTTPEFLEVHAERFAETGRVRFVVVDEAHHVGLSRAGHRPAYGRLDTVLERLGRPLTLGVTATCTDEAADACRRILGVTELVLDPSVRDNLAIEDRRGAADRDALLAALAARGEKTIVYVNSREQSVRIARMLRKRVPERAMHVAFYNGGLTRASRHAVERAFRAGDLTLVVSTSAFGEGVNIPDVRHVVLYHLPFNEVEFNQMSGRAGRDGAEARVHLLFGPGDARVNDLVLSSQAPDREDMATLYLTLRDLQPDDGSLFEATNAELAERCRARRRGFSLDERGVSTAISVFRELGLVASEGHGAYRRLTVVAAPGVRVELEDSVRYAEGRREIAQFAEFRDWVLSADADSLLARFNRPILPSRY